MTIQTAFNRKIANRQAVIASSLPAESRYDCAAPFWAWVQLTDGAYRVWPCKRRTQAQWRYRWIERMGCMLDAHGYGWSAKD